MFGFLVDNNELKKNGSNIHLLNPNGKVHGNGFAKNFWFHDQITGQLEQSPAKKEVIEEATGLFLICHI